MTRASALKSKIQEVARVPLLMVATDYDGTLAPIVDDPSMAIPDRQALVALNTLASLPQTEVAIISGRSLTDLAKLSSSPQGVHLVGSHGSEFEAGFANQLSSSALDRKQKLFKKLQAWGKPEDGFFIEEKPAGFALHYRHASRTKAAQVRERIETAFSDKRGMHLKHGKKVIEISVVKTNKGDAIQRFRHRWGIGAVVFIGDDVTDEDGFKTLRGPDVGIKVGSGKTAAKFRVRNTEDVTQLLAELAEYRCEWLEGKQAHPIEEHTLLSDHRTIALMQTTGRIVWYCVPRIDSNAIFSELVDSPSSGHFSISGLNGEPPKSQSYIDKSLVVETKFQKFKVTDYLDVSGGLPNQRAARSDLIRVLEGRGTAEIEFAPRLDFGRIPTRLVIHDNAIEVEDTPEPLVLYAPGVKWEIFEEGNHQTAKTKVRLSEKKPTVLELRYGTANVEPSFVPELDKRKKTLHHWQNWAKSLHLPKKLRRKERELMLRSALMLKALCHGPTGGIAAAATTSLPEGIGGIRNWDYRFSWLRDGALSSRSLVALGSIHEGMKFLDWMFYLIDRSTAPERLRPLYTVTGGSVPSEAELTQLSGYSGSRPVRIGNSAAHQVQLDVFGPVVDLVYHLHEAGAPLSYEHWKLVEAMVEAVAHRWREPDHGIWEIRGPRQHHVHTKLMCWVTVDRALKMSRRLQRKSPENWKKLRDDIRQEILQSGWNKDRKAFTTAFDNEGLDAAVLQLLTTGFLKPNDSKFKQTLRAIEEELLVDGAVYRYRFDDYLPGDEGAFHYCTTWLIQTYYLMNETKKATDLLNLYQDFFGSTGLIPEEYCPQKDRGLGNTPQAYSHLGYIDAILTRENLLKT